MRRGIKQEKMLKNLENFLNVKRTKQQRLTETVQAVPTAEVQTVPTAEVQAVPTAEVENSNGIPSLLFRNIHLKKVSEEDYSVLFGFRNSKAFISNCTNRQLCPSFDNFKTELANDFKRDRFEQFMILREGKVLGTIFSYNYSSQDGYLYITTYIDNPKQDRGVGAIAFSILCKHYFTSLSLFKIYVDIYSFNKASLKMFIKRKAKIEGLFYRQRLIDDTRVDVFRFAIYQEDLTKI